MAIVLDGTTGITTPDLTDTSLTSGRVVYAGTSGNLTGASTFVFDGSNLGVGAAPDSKFYVGGGALGTVRFFYNGTSINYNDVDAQIWRSASASEYMRLNSVGLGIGTSSPSTKLAVAGGISGTGGLNISGGGWGVLPYVANSLVIDNNAGESRFFATGANTTTDGSFLFYTGQTDGGANLRATINSSGYLTVPNQPMFSVNKTNGNVLGAVSPTPMIFNTVQVNQSSSYSTSTGRFTAPVAGTYYFSFIGMLSSTGSGADLQMIINKNGTSQSISNPATTGGSVQGMGFACSCIISLAVNDYVTVTFYSNIGASASIYAGGGAFNNFSGFLIG